MRFPALVAIVLSLGLVAPRAASAQIEGIPGADADGAGELVDGIAAVVGDSIVLHSQVVEVIQQLGAQGQPIPDDPAQLDQLQRDITQDLVDHLLMVQAAEQDTTVVVADEEVDDAFQEMWRDLVANFEGEENLRQALEQQGMGFERYRQSRRTEIHQQLLLQRFFGMQTQGLRATPVHEREVREFFDEQRDQLGERPATVSFEHLFVQGRASEAAEAAAREQAEEILAALAEGESFEDLARQHSDDAGSAQQGGDIGWYRRGDGLIEEFEDAAFRLGEGQVSGIVETNLGAHIIRVDRVRGPERRIHHILVAADVSDEDEARLQERVDRIVEAVRAGEPLASFRDEGMDIGIPAELTRPRDQLTEDFPSEYGQALRDASSGDVVGPVEFPLQEGVTVYAIAQVNEVREAGEFRFEDVRDQIRERVREQKFEQRLLDEIRARTYVDIRL